MAQQALKSFRRGSKLEPENAYAHILLARAAEQIWREGPADIEYLQNSRESYAAALKLDSRNLNIHLLFIGVCSKLGELDNTLILYEGWLEANPGESVLQRAQEALKEEIQILGSGRLEKIAGISEKRTFSIPKGTGLLVILVGVLGFLQIGLWLGQTRVGEGSIFELALGVVFLASSSAGGIAMWASRRE